ncbi:MAG: hypothetical protein WC642_09420 [Nocardioides sp.]
MSVAFAIVVATLTLTPPGYAQKIRPEFFGMHDSQIANGSVPGVHVGAVRLWDTGTTWREIETAPGSYDWSKVDAAVDTARGAGLRPMLVLGQTPQFHAVNPLAPGAYGDGATSMPRLAAWTKYVKAAANRYGTKVDYQVWNEPNVINYWTGTVSQMASLTAAASKAINSAAGSSATIVAPSFPLRLASQQKWYGKYWAAKANGKGMASYVDVVAANLYPLSDQGPEESIKLRAFVKRVLPTAARGKPMWNTEINYGLLGGPTAKPIPVAKQVAFVGRTMLLNAANDVQRMYWYGWAQGGIANTHLVEDDRSTLTAAGRAWDVARGWILGTDMKSCARTASGALKGLYTCTARKSSTEVRRFYWKPSGASVKITTAQSTKSWSDLSDHTTKKSGKYQIKIGQSPIMVTSRS